MKTSKQEESQSLEGFSYWQLVWRNFKKKKSATFSLVVIFFFFFIAVFAPFLANEKPLALYTQYKEFYRYYFESWSNVEEKFRYSLTHREELLEQQKQAQLKFNSLREEVYQLSQTRDSLETEYQEIKSTLESLESEIQEIIAKEDQKEDQKVSSEISSLEKQKADLEEKRKKLGAKQLSIKGEKLKSETQKEYWNLRLLELKNQLDEEKWSLLILNSLKKMEFSLSPSLGKSLSLFRKEYKKVFLEEELGRKITGLENLRTRVEKAVSPFSSSFSEKELSFRWTFPAVESLSYRDLFFMSIFLFFLFLPKFWKIFRRRVPFFYVGLGFWVLIFFILWGGKEILSSGQNVPTNYKKWIVEEFQGPSEISEGASDHWVLLAWVAYGLNENSVEERYQKPSIFAWGETEKTGGKRGRHLLGTDATGRDVLSRMIWGARVSLSVGFVAVSIYVLIGILLGSLAGYFVGKVDMIISRIIEIVICFPSFFLILTIIAFVGNSIFNIMVVIGLTSWPGVARLVRGEFLKLRTLDFVTAARALGVSTWRIVLRHILPNALTPVLVSVSFGIASAMLVEAGLSFLGFGVQEPFPSWGQMISTGQSDVLNYWWLSVIPGLAIFISVTTYNLVGDALREAIDPKLKEIA